jgi:acyl-CoA dehydrogenase
MMNHATTEVFLDDVRGSGDALVGEEGQGVPLHPRRMNAERILIAAECIGDGRWFVDKAARYASERVVFGRPIGANQACSFPIARRTPRSRRPISSATRPPGCSRPGALRPGGERRQAARSEASWQAPTPASTRTGATGSRPSTTSSGSFRETRLYSIAPISNNLVLAYVGQHVSGMPRSY